MDQDVEPIIMLSENFLKDHIPTIKPCPVCGCFPEGEQSFLDNETYYLLKCPNYALHQCEVRPLLYTTSQPSLGAAIAAWNYRVYRVGERMSKRKQQLVRCVPFDEIKHDDFTDFLRSD